MPTSYWWEAFSTSINLINRLPNATLQNLSPFEMLYHKKLDYKSFKIFGCAFFPCLRPYNQHKLQYHSTKCVFLGYNGSHNGFKCLSSISHIYISQHVVFNEKDYPFTNGFLVFQKPQQSQIVQFLADSSVWCENHNIELVVDNSTFATPSSASPPTLEAHHDQSPTIVDR